MLRKRWLHGLIVALFAFSSHASDDPSSAVLLGKEAATQKRVEVALFPLGASFRNTLVKHPYATQLALGYHATNWFQVELVGGYVFLHDETNLAKRVRTMTHSSLSLLTDLWQTTWQFGLNGQWIPFYGKLSFLAQVQTPFQLYLLLGAGVEGIVRAVDAAATTKNWRYAINWGGGLRLFLTDRIALRSEIKQTLGFNPRLENGEKDIGWVTWAIFGFSIFI